MMKYDVKDLTRTLEYLKKNGDPAQIEVKFDHMERMILSFFDSIQSEGVTITLYPSESAKMPDVTRTTRL